MATGDVKLMIAKNAEDQNVVTFENGTGLKMGRETNSSSTTTFDRVIPQGTKITPFTIELDRVEYDPRKTAQEIDMLLDYMVENPVFVKVTEVKRVSGEPPYVIEYLYKDCLLDGDDVELKPEEHSVGSLKIRASSREKKYVDYTGE